MIGHLARFNKRAIVLGKKKGAIGVEALVFISVSIIFSSVENVGYGICEIRIVKFYVFLETSVLTFYAFHLVYVLSYCMFYNALHL